MSSTHPTRPFHTTRLSFPCQTTTRMRARRSISAFKNASHENPSLHRLTFAGKAPLAIAILPTHPVRGGIAADPSHIGGG